MRDRGKTDAVRRRDSNAALLLAYHGRGDREARTRVIEQNLPLVRTLARRFSRPSVPFDDLVQVGAIGLIKAIDGFRQERGRDLGAYAVPTIVGELRHYVRERAGGTGTGAADDRRVPAVVPLEGASLEAPETDAERTETRALVRTAIRALDPRERRIVALRFYSDLSQQRIAEEVGLSQVQVSRLLSTSLAKMRETLEVG